MYFVPLRAPRRPPAPALLLAASLALGACGRGEQRTDPDAFAFRERMPAGSWLHVRGGSGEIRIARAPGDSIVVTAAKRWRGDRPEDVNFTVSRRGSEVIVCAVWGDTGRCDTDHIPAEESVVRRWVAGLRRSRVEVDFTVAVPAGINVDARQAYGDITADGVAGQVVARAVAGHLMILHAGAPARAMTGEGDVIARFDSIAGEGEISLRTTRGDVAAEVPASLGARLALRAPAGSARSDFPDARGGADVRSVSATLGAGGRDVTLETLRGDVVLRARR